MKEYNYKNLADESNFGSQVYRAGMFDKILGISKTAKEAANQVISKMGNDLKLEARKAAQDEVKKIEGKMLTLAEEKANKIASEKANQIEKKISTSIDKTVKSVEANAEKAAKNAAEKAVKKVGPEVADLLKPEIKTQVEEAVKKYTEEKIESLIKPEITSKIGDFLTEQSKKSSKFLEYEMNKLIENAHRDLDTRIDKIECELIEAKSEVLKTAANSLNESADLLFSAARDETCENQDLVYF
ncbi:hypothetical protein [Wolbachia endosymbiont of Erebia cassioides]|uniref:hypothetical protein n=1 Tax=Wolbachia endosymbiont of Erebia cassioides TaxID=2803379 RepID=UPI001FE55AFD|nr:hypothetical protein [Wolbachia endosymbiont of Erebia cassioides]